MLASATTISSHASSLTGNSAETDKLHFVVIPSTLNKHETEWILSDDGKYALSSGANVILWDVALGSPLIVYPGTVRSVRFSNHSPRLAYFAEQGNNWSLRDLSTAEIKGFFTSDEIPKKNTSPIPDSFLKKVMQSNLPIDFTDMDVNEAGNKIALAGLIPMLWDLHQAEPKTLVSSSHSQWININDYINRSAKSHSSVSSIYHNARCAFESDSAVYFSFPGHGIHLFDVGGNYLKHIDCNETITQLRKFRNFIIAEREDNYPAIMETGGNSLHPIKSRDGNKLPLRKISEISDDGYFIGIFWDMETAIGQLRDDGTARWGILEDCSGIYGSPIDRLYLSKSATRLSFSRSYESYIPIHRLDVQTDKLRRSFVLPHFCDFKRGLRQYSGAFINDSTFIAGTVSGEAFIGNTNSDAVLNEPLISDPLLSHEGAVVGVAGLDDTRFATVDSYGTVRIFDSTTFELLMTMRFFYRSSDYIVYTPDNYYKATKGAVDKIFYAKGLDSFTFKQFDLKYNRPDIILERLGGNPDQIRILRSAWEKRLKRMGFTESIVASAESHAPELSFAISRSASSLSDKSKVILDINAEDDKSTIQSLHVLINDVPVYGSNGKAIKKTNKYSESISLQLAEGNNTITVYCINSNGQESLHHQLAVENAERNTRKKLFIAAVGVSEYEDSNHNLCFAAADAETFTSALANNNGKFSDVETLVLKDNEFNVNSLSELESFFNKTSRDDVAVLYYAGHGLLDNSLDYYLACASTDFKNIEETSVRYDDFQDVLERIPSLHRFCFIDACHSGDIDKDEILAVNVIPVEEYGDLTFRTGGKRIISSVNREVARLYHSMFVDLSQKSGITVISSSNGDELSMESAAYGGGLFTGMLKEALSGKCDSDNDGSITSNELLDYVTRKVSKISAGRQNPQVKFHDYDKATILK